MLEKAGGTIGLQRAEIDQQYQQSRSEETPDTYNPDGAGTQLNN